MPRLFYARIIAPAYDRPRPRPHPRPHPRPLVLHPAFQPYPQRSEEAEGSRGFLASLCAPCFTGILSLPYHPSCSPWTQSPSFHLPPSCLRHENGRLDAHLETTGGLLKNALAPSTVLLIATLCPHLSLSLSFSLGKVFQTLKIPTALRGEARIDIYAYIAYSACRAIVCICSGSIYAYVRLYVRTVPLLHVLGR